MRRTLALLVAVLSYFSAFAQEVEPSGSNIPEFTVVPRIDLNPYIPVGKGHGRDASFDLGNTSLYTFLEGSIGEHFSYSMSNHWLSTDPKALYENSLRSDDCNWLDWLTLSYSVGGFSFTLGKDMLSIGGFELDAYDVDSHYNISSTMWHNLAIYQWGGKVEYTTPSEDSTIAFQFASSPFGEHPFASKLFTYLLYWTGEYGCYSPIWSANFMEYERGRFISILSLGNRFDIGDFAIELDYMNRANSIKDFFKQDMSVVARAAYNHNDKFEVFVKGGYERGGMDFFGYGDEWELDGSIVPSGIMADKDYLFYGAGIHYYPLHESQDLRLHAVIAGNNYANDISVTVGATYFFNLTKTVLSNRKR